VADGRRFGQVNHKSVPSYTYGEEHDASTTYDDEIFRKILGETTGRNDGIQIIPIKSKTIGHLFPNFQKSYYT